MLAQWCEVALSLWCEVASPLWCVVVEAVEGGMREVPTAHLQPGRGKEADGKVTGSRDEEGFALPHGGHRNPVK